MRVIPCRSASCNGRPAMLPPSTLHPEGEPHVAGRYVASVRCDRCGHRTGLSASDYASLPTLSVEDFARLAREHRAPALAALPTQDLEGAGFTRAQAAYLYDAAGVRGAIEAESLVRAMTE